MLKQFSLYSAEFMVILFASLLFLAIATVIAVYFIDISQTRHTIRRNYPVIGRFRGFFEHLGTFFRQYFYAMDREELPFNRALRVWVYRAAKGKLPSNGFGSTADLNKSNTPIFLNAPYPMLDEETQTQLPPIIGANQCQQPYQPGSYFNISGMSYGALSDVAVTSLSQGAASANCWLNTGEGGLSEYHLKGNCDIVFQIGTACYGVRNEHGELDLQKLADIAAKPQVKMFEIKLSQGAKPGKGGILPAEKVSDEIAAIRAIPAGQASLSPNRHRNIDSDDALLAFIAKIKSTTGKPVGIKFVLGDAQWIQSLCKKLAATDACSRPDFFTLDGGDGGTGSAPQPLLDFVGLPLQQSLPVVSAALQDNDLSAHIKLICSGKLINPSAAAWALCNGADFCVSARGFMLSLGCIQAMQCHKNTCPTGITTHNKKLQRGLNPAYKSVRVANYHRNMVKSIEMIAHSCGLSNANAFQSHNVKLLHTTS